MSKKKWNWRSWLKVAFFSLMLTSLVNVAHAKTITLTLADTTAPTGLRGEGVTCFIEEVEKHTNGQVKIQVHWGESLLKGQEILGGVKDGIVDMGYINPNYFPKQMIVTGAFALLPQGPRKFTNIHWFYSKCFEEIPALKAEMERLKLQPIYTNTVLPMVIASTKPFTKFEDFKGKRIRAASRWSLGELKGAGAVPVSIPWGDCYMALQTGTIEGVFTNLDGIHRTKLDEVAKNIYASQELWVGVPFIYAINTDKWKSLPADIKKQILSAGESAAKRFEKLYENEWARIEAEQKKMGCTITAVSPDDIRKWATMPVIDKLQQEWQKETEAIGVKDAGNVLNTLKALVKEAIKRDNQ